MNRVRALILCQVRVLVAFITFSSFSLSFAISQDPAAYQSPYKVELPFPVEELIPDLIKGERGAPTHESEIPFAEWNRPGHKKFGSWGPPARHYPFPNLADGKSEDWKRARIIATAMRFIGYRYRHHHIPDWDPPHGLHTTGEGEPSLAGKGVDCSNFTSFVYNQGLGIHLNSDINKQSQITKAQINGTSKSINIQTLPIQANSEDWVKQLKPGDLIYVRSNQGKISHVIMWIGDWGKSPDGTPLIMDSHGAKVKDSNGVMIPDGIYLRPYRSGSWYAKSSDHAHRIID